MLIALQHAYDMQISNGSLAQFVSRILTAKTLARLFCLWENDGYDLWFIYDVGYYSK